MVIRCVKQLTSIGIMFAITFSLHSVFASDKVIFNPQSGQLMMPKVSVDLEHYTVEMQKTTREGFNFQLSHATLLPIDYRQEMRDFVVSLSLYANREKGGEFLIVPQNGQELLTDTGGIDGIPQMTYLQAIDATGREDLFYGSEKDDEATPASTTQSLLHLGLLAEKYHIEVLTTDYCSTQTKVMDSYQRNDANGFISFAANARDLNVIPRFPTPIHHENTIDIRFISQAKNFLYLIDSNHYETKHDFIQALAETNYDLMIVDIFHHDALYTKSELERLKVKKNGAKRLVIGYLSIGEAEDYRDYWQTDWRVNPPAWLDTENPDWAGNFKVKYWNAEWQAIIFGHEQSYVKKAIDSGFDGVYLDIIDAFEFFEAKSS